MKFFFITPHYTIYLSFLILLISTSVLPAQSLDIAENTQITQTTLQITQTNIELHEDQVAITWMTQGESDLDLFVVQRSLDGKNWEQIIAIAASGNTTQQQIYQTTDSRPYEGESYYRIGQVDYNGEEIYSVNQPIVYDVPMERFFSAQYLKVNR